MTQSGPGLDRGAAGTVRIAHADFSNTRGAAMRYPMPGTAPACGSEAGVLIQVGIHQVDNLLCPLVPALRVTARFQHRDLDAGMPDAAVVAMATT